MINDLWESQISVVNSSYGTFIAPLNKLPGLYKIYTGSGNFDDLGQQNDNIAIEYIKLPEIHDLLP